MDFVIARQVLSSEDLVMADRREPVFNQEAMLIGFARAKLPPAGVPALLEHTAVCVGRVLSLHHDHSGGP